MKTYSRACLWFLGAIAIAKAGAQEIPRSPICWPMHFAGVTAGINREHEVQRLLGNGVALDREGDRSRYYVGRSRTATLRFDFSDSLVEEITLQQGIDRHLKPAELRLALSKWFDPNEGFGNWGELHLGSSKAQVTENLGAPEEQPESDAWRYESKCACELPEYFTVYFKAERVTKVVFSAPSG